MSTDILVFVVPFVIFLLLGMPIPLILGVSSLVAVFAANLPVITAFQRVFSGVGQSFPLLAIPPFVFAGALLAKGSLITCIIDISDIFVGRVRGGLAIVAPP